MFCQGCKVEIPPSWAAAIARNVCPNCNESIISEESKKLMEDLLNAIIKMSATPEELTGWLMSTYDMLPKGSVEAATFHRKPTSQQMIQENMDLSTQGLKYANTPTAQFMKRSGADKILKDPKLAAIAQAINSINAIDGQMYGGGVQTEPDLDDISSEEQDMMEQQKITQMAAKAKAQGRKLTMKEVLANDSNSVEFNMDGDSRPLSEAETELVKHFVGGPNSSDSEMDGLESIHPMLHGDRLKRLAAQRALTYGGSTGLIKRAE